MRPNTAGLRQDSGKVRSLVQDSEKELLIECALDCAYQSCDTVIREPKRSVGKLLSLHAATRTYGRSYTPDTPALCNAPWPAVLLAPLPSTGSLLGGRWMGVRWEMGGK